MVEPTDGSVTRYEVWTIRVYASILLILMLVTCFGIRRAIDVDELILYNPIYTYLHDGRMTFPIHGQPDSMTIHPPVHYLVVAGFMKLGLGFFYAELLPTVLLFLLTLVLVDRGKFPFAVKFGLMTGAFGGLMLYVLSIRFTAHFSVRPDIHLAAAWFAGLVALESARLDGWQPRRLFLGSFLLTYASGLHYFGAPAFLGLVVYGVWVVQSLGFAKAKIPLLAILVGSCLFGIPYLLFFVIPDWSGILEIVRGVQQNGGVPEAIARHFAAYEYLKQGTIPHSLIGLCLIPLTWLKIPAPVLSTPLLLIVPATRGIALAGLPLLLFVLLYSQGKSGGYYFPEFMLYLTSLAIVCVELPRWLWQRFAPRRVPESGITIAVVMAIGVVLSHDWLIAVRPYIALQPMVHEMEVTRAVSREMVGPEALVAGRMSRWYVGGGAFWYDVFSDLMLNEPPDDLRAYFGTFDAIAENSHMSNATQNQARASLPSWYLDRTLYLKGFYFSDNSDNLSHLLLHVKQPDQIRGFAYRGNQLYRFQEQPDGNHLFVAAQCPYGLHTKESLSAIFFNRLPLPNADPASNSTPTQDLTTMIVPRRSKADGRSQDYPGQFLTQCTIRDEIVGSLEPVATAPFLAKLSQDKAPIRFTKTLAEAQVRWVRPDQRIPIYSAKTDWNRWQPGNNRTTVKLLPTEVLAEAQPNAPREAPPTILHLKSNRSTNDPQLFSPPIPVKPNSTYLIRLDTTPLQGGWGWTLTNEHQQILEARTWCQPKPLVPINTEFVVTSQESRQFIFTIHNCNQKISKTTRLELRDLTIQQVEMIQPPSPARL